MSFVKKALKKYNTIPLPAKAALWFVVCSVLQKSIAMLTMPIFTRIMTKEQMGQFNVYNSWLQILTMITTFRLNYAVFNKGMSKFKEDRDAYTSTMQSTTFIITSVFFGIYLIFREPINNFIELPTFIMVAIFMELLIAPAIDFWTIRKRYEYIYKPVVIRTLLMSVLNAGLGVAAVLISDEKGYARIISCVIVNLAFGLMLFFYNAKKAKTLFVAKYAKFALLFNIPLFLHYLSQYVLDSFDRIMVQKMVGIEAIALYGVAYNAGMLMRIFTQSLNNAIVPWQYDKLEKKEHKQLDDTTFLVLILMGVLTLMFAAFAPELMLVLAGRNYQEAVYVIPPVAVGMFFSFAYSTFANVEFFYNQTKFTMYISMGGALLNIGLNYIFINWFGYIAAAYTTLFCFAVFALTHYFYMTYSVKKAIGVNRIYRTGRMMILFLVIIVLGLLVVFLYDLPIVRYALIGAVLIAAIIKHKAIIKVLKSVRKPKKPKQEASQEAES